MILYHIDDPLRRKAKKKRIETTITRNDKQDHHTVIRTIEKQHL